MEAAECHRLSVLAVDIARAMTRKVPIKLVWVVEELAQSEGLLVHYRFNVAGAGLAGIVRSPKDLKAQDRLDGLRVRRGRRSESRLAGRSTMR